MVPCGETWLTGDNRLMALHDMSERHLENAINHLWSHNDEGRLVEEVSDDDLNMIEAMKEELERRQQLREQHGAGVAPF